MFLGHLPINSAGLTLQNLGRFADTGLEGVSVRLEAAGEHSAPLTNKEVLTLLWALLQVPAGPVSAQ